MADFGGLGGISGGRGLNADDLFKQAVERALGEQMRADDSLCREVWSALANVDWRHANGDTAGYSFRAAGDLIAAIIGRGDYTDWHCSGPYAVVSDRVDEALSNEGWIWEEVT
jgi:hypothetical protein